jgi:hypothetical protein
LIVFKRTLILSWLGFVAVVALVFMFPKHTGHVLGAPFFPLSMLGLLIATAIYKIVSTYKIGMTRH